MEKENESESERLEIVVVQSSSGALPNSSKHSKAVAKIAPRKTKHCEHGRQKSHCRICGGSIYCKHDKRKSYCKVDRIEEEYFL